MQCRFLLSVFCLISLFTNAQKDTIKERTEIYDVYFSAGSSSFPVFTMSQADFSKIAKHSQILTGDIAKVDLNNLNDSSGSFNRSNSNTAFYLQAGITLKLKNKNFRNAGPWLKVGVNYFSTSNFLSTGVFISSHQDYNNAYSVGGNQVNRTVLNRQSVDYDYSCKSLNFEGTLVYRLNPAGIFSLYGGPGALLGMNFDGQAKLKSLQEKITNDYLIIPGAGQVLYKSDAKDITTTERFRTHPNLSFGLFVNIGADLRLGSTYAVVKNMHLFGELKPMFRSYAVQGGGFQNSILLVSSVGLRYQFE